MQLFPISLDGKSVALGSRDNNIYVYNVEENGRKFSRIGRCSVSRMPLQCINIVINNVTHVSIHYELYHVLTCTFYTFQGHSSFVTHIDWSVDNQHLQSNSGDYEILYCKSAILLTRFLLRMATDTLNMHLKFQLLCSFYEIFREWKHLSSSDLSINSAGHGVGDTHLYSWFQCLW